MEAVERLNISEHGNNSLFGCDISKSCLSEYDPDSTINLFRFIVHGVILGTVEILGICGNVLSIIVLSQPQIKSSISYLLIGLAVIDTILIINAMIMFTLSSIYPYTGHFLAYKIYFLPYFLITIQPLMTSAHMSSIYLTLAVTLERYVAVCHPLQAKSVCTLKISKRAVYAIISFSILYHSPMYLENKIVQFTHNECDLIVNCIHPTDIGNNTLYITIYWEWMHSFFISLFPFTSLAIFNTCIFREVRRSNKRREQLTGTQKTEIDLATMLLYIVAVFFICNSVFPILHIHRYFITDGTLIIWPILKDLGLCLIVINSCVNFIIYIVCGAKFKELFKKIILKHSSLTKSQATTLKISKL